MFEPIMGDLPALLIVCALFLILTIYILDARRFGKTKIFKMSEDQQYYIVQQVNGKILYQSRSYEAAMNYMDKHSK